MKIAQIAKNSNVPHIFKFLYPDLTNEKYNILSKMPRFYNKSIVICQSCINEASKQTENLSLEEMKDEIDVFNANQ